LHYTQAIADEIVQRIKVGVDDGRSMADYFEVL